MLQKHIKDKLFQKYQGQTFKRVSRIVFQHNLIYPRILTFCIEGKFGSCRCSNFFKPFNRISNTHNTWGKAVSKFDKTRFTSIGSLPKMLIRCLANKHINCDNSYLDLEDLSTETCNMGCYINQNTTLLTFWWIDVRNLNCVG